MLWVRRQELVEAMHFLLTDGTPKTRDCWVFADSRIQMRAVNPSPRRHPLHSTSARLRTPSPPRQSPRAMLASA